MNDDAWPWRKTILDFVAGRNARLRHIVGSFSRDDLTCLYLQLMLTDGSRIRLPKGGLEIVLDQMLAAGGFNRGTVSLIQTMI